MADIHDLRKKNLKALVQQWEGPTNLARQLGYSSPSYVSQMVSGNRPITEKSARLFEGKLNLPGGWFDTAHAGPATARAALVDTSLVSKVISTVGNLLDEAGVHLAPAKFAELVAMVYEESARTGTVDEQFIQRIIKLVR